MSLLKCVRVIGKHVNEARDVLTAAFEESAKLLEEKKVQAKLASEVSM